VSLPKVLILNQPFNNDTGGGITLTNLFAGWDKNKLAVACSGYLLRDNIDTKICNTYYRLGNNEFKWRFPFKYIQGNYSSGLLKFNEKQIQNVTVQKSKLRVKLIAGIFYPLLEYFGLYHTMSRTEMSKDFCDWLNDFDPDVIYVQVSSRNEILFCLAVQAYLKKPLIFHMMDDWPTIISSKGLFKNKWQKKIDKELRLLLDKADVLMGISDLMASEYKTRYGKDFITFHNPINIEFWKKYQRKDYELNDSPTILYAGRIGLGINHSLELIAKAIAQVNEELKTSVRFIIQTQEKPAWITNYKNVEHTSFVSYDELPKIFSETDFLILPYDFSQTAIKYIKYSMPTKAPEYMVSGTPIIIFAPEVTAVVKYAKKHNWAKVITESNVSSISEAIKNLIQDKELREQIAQNAINVAEKNHNSIDVTAQFKNVILTIAE